MNTNDKQVNNGKSWSHLFESLSNQDTKFLDGEAHGWIQWKGTDVCMDTHCECGYHGHMDSDFFSFYKCPKCGIHYAVGCNVKFIKLNSEHVKEIKIDWEFKTDPIMEED